MATKYVTFAALASEAQPDINGVPASMIQRALRNATIKFCRQTYAWAQTRDYYLAEGQNSIPLKVPDYARLEAVLEVRVGGCKLRRYNFQDRPASAAGVSGYYVQSEDAPCVGLVGTPSVDLDAVCVFAVYVPQRSADRIPDWLAEDWYQAIVNGARADLFDTPGSHYNDEKARGQMQRMFNKDIADAKLQFARGRNVAERFAHNPNAGV